MKQRGIAKKYILPTLTVLYDVSTLFWYYVIISGLMYNFSRIFVRDNGIGIIGGADTPTLMFQVGNLLKSIPALLFLAASIGTAVLLTLLARKKYISRKASIALCVCSVVSFIAFFFIHVDTYLVSLYAVVRSISLVYCTYIVQVVLSGAVVFTSVWHKTSCR